MIKSCKLLCWATLATGLSLIFTNGQLFSVASYFVSGLARLPLELDAKAGGRPEKLRSESDKGPVTLLALGDIASCGPRNRWLDMFNNVRFSLGLLPDSPVSKTDTNASSQILKEHAKANFLALGDLVYATGSPAQYARCYDQHWGEFKDRTFPTPGNHDYGSPFANGYFSYWRDHQYAAYKEYYSFKLSNWLLLSINSELSLEPNSTQYRWIRREIARTDAHCILAFYHRPSYSSRKREGSDRMSAVFDLLHASGVSLVLTGHNHFYERLKPLGAGGIVDWQDGMLSFVIGTGDKTKKYAGEVSNLSAKLIANTPGMFKLTLHDNSYRWEFLDAKSRTPMDSGDAPCRKPPLLRTL